MQLEREIETRLARDREFEDLRKLVYRDYGRPASLALAELKYGEKVSWQESTAMPANSWTQRREFRAQSPLSPDVNSVKQDLQTPERSDNSNNNRDKRELSGPTLRAPEYTSRIPSATLSRNSYINGSRIYNRQKDGLLCVKCGISGHISSDCSGQRLEPWEHIYLRNLAFHRVQPTDNLAANSNEISDAFDNCRGSWRRSEEPDVAPRTFPSERNTPGRSIEIEARSESDNTPNITLEQFVNQAYHKNEAVKSFQCKSACLSNEESVKVVSLESYLGDHPKKRQRVEIEDLLNEEDNEPSRRAQRK